jgi:hypothetical protein
VGRGRTRVAIADPIGDKQAETAQLETRINATPKKLSAQRADQLGRTTRPGDPTSNR